MKRILAIIALLAMTLFPLSACGEKYCSKRGSLKAENGELYHCEDRGNGLRWYKE